jgi:hypothetical protein
VAPFQEFAMANALRSQTEHSAKVDVTFACTRYCFSQKGISWEFSDETSYKRTSGEHLRTAKG